ncbi:MAG: FHA domain-containing protein [Elainellaceae cyanobacterium]
MGSRSATLQAPIAIGRDLEQMPNQVSGQALSHLKLDHKQVSRYHALITVTNRRLYVIDKSANGTFLNGRSVSREGQPFTTKDTLRVGPFKITASLLRDGATNATELNPDRSQYTSGGASTGPNAVIIGLVGAAILLIMGLGTWAIASGFLEQARPDPDKNASSTDIRQVEIETTSAL